LNGSNRRAHAQLEVFFDESGLFLLLPGKTVLFIINVRIFTETVHIVRIKGPLEVIDEVGCTPQPR
jgi:hypothetical protein